MKLRPAHYAIGRSMDTACGIYSVWNRGLNYTRDRQRVTCGHCRAWLQRESPIYAGLTSPSGTRNLATETEHFDIDAPGMDTRNRRDRDMKARSLGAMQHVHRPSPRRERFGLLLETVVFAALVLLIVVAASVVPPR